MSTMIWTTRTDMYHRDVPIIRSHVVDSKNPDVMLDLVTFVLCTIRVPLIRVLGQVQDVWLRGSQSASLWGFKRKGYEYTGDNLGPLYELLLASEDHMLYDELLKVPGLGYAKAAFVMQCLGFNYGCLDVHNLRELGVSQKKKLKKEEYLSLMTAKTTDKWWDDWCNFIPNSNHWNTSFSNGDEVSKFHVKCVVR